MRKIALLAVGLTALTVTACAPSYYDRPYGPRYYSGGYGDRDRDGVPNRYDRDRDNDGVPNAYDRRPGNPYRD